MDTEKELKDLLTTLKAEIKGIREVVKQSASDARHARQAAENIPKSLYGKLVIYEDLVEKSSMLDSLYLLKENLDATKEVVKELEGTPEQLQLANYLLATVEYQLEQMIILLDD